MNRRTVKKILGIMVLSLASLLVVPGACESASALTYQQDIDMSFTFNPTLSVSLSSADLTIDSLSPGTAADSNIVTVNILTNSVVGYTLNATVGNNTTYNTRNLVHNNTSESASFASVDYSSTPTITSNTALSPSTWAYSYSTNNGTTWANYNGLPLYSDTTNIATLKDTDGPVSSSTGDEVKFKIAAKADYDQQVGTYGNVVNFALVAKTIPAYSVTLGLSGAESIIIDKGTPNEATYTSGSTIESLTVGIHTISGTFPTGYNFGSWSASGGVTVADATSPTTTIYVSGNGALTLTGSSSKTYMQNISASTLATLMPNVGDEVTLTDARDGKDYTVAHLADGNYWMTQNLDHDIKTDGSVTYDSTTTDIPSAWTPSTATYATNDDTWNGSYTAPESYDPGDLCWDGTINEDWDGTLDNETTTCGSDKHMSIGNYYNWTAALAMNDSSNYGSTSNVDVDQSICPAGWRLPIGGTANTGSKSFQYLWDQYSSSFDENTMMNSPLYFSYAGYWYGNSGYVGSDGYYWSSVVTNSYYAYELYFEAGGGVDPQGGYGRSYGNSIRCVAR